MKRKASLSFLLLFGCLALAQCISKTVYPELESECKSHAVANESRDSLNRTLTELLQTNSTNNALITLSEPGCYLLEGFFLISSTTNFTITGSSGGEHIINCITSSGQPAGLAFVGVQSLQLSNITISNCGIFGTELEKTVNIIKNDAEIFYRISSQIQYGMIIAESSDVAIEYAKLTQTTGLGLLAINIGGISSLTKVEFTENHPSLCHYESLNNLTSELTIGGAMFLLYVDYKDSEHNANDSQLRIRDCIFHKNSYCSSFNALSAFYGQSATANQIGYVAGSAAAIGIALAQLQYSVDIDIESTNFTNNSGLFGAGVYVGIFEGVDRSNITFMDCEFTNNGYSNYTEAPLGLHSESAGLQIYDSLYFPNETLRNLCLSGLSEFPVYVHVINSKFSNNKAFACVSLWIRSFRSTLVTTSHQNVFHVLNSSFTDNQGSVGSVACAIASEFSGFSPSFKFIFEDVTVADNTAVTSNDGISNQLVESSGQMLLVSVDLLLSGRCVFANNSGVPLVGYSSLIRFHGSTSFIDNKGVFGGAIRLISQSYLVIYNNSDLLFANNTATVQGGAIFFFASIIGSSNPLGDSDCFLYFQSVDIFCNYSKCPDIASMNINISFTGNVANIGGTIFGSTLNNCPWYKPLNQSLNQSLRDTNIKTALQLLAQLHQFHFDPPLNDSSVVSTHSTILEFSKKDIVISPGERVRLQGKAFDGFGFRASTAILSTSTRQSSISTSLGNAKYYFINSADVDGTSVPIDVYGQENDSAIVELYSVDSGTQFIITVNTSQCGPGFTYDHALSRCVCIKELESKHVQCNASEEVLVIPDNHWFGYLDESEDVLVYSTCFYDYCKPSSIAVNVLDLDFQCNTGYRRTGLACGKCEPNTSTVFGTSRCKECSNMGLLWILGFAIAGIVMVFGISFLGITITEGYLNGFIFYCNSLNYFVVYLSPEYPYDPIFSPAAWINLALGIETCFFDGMNTLIRIGLRFVFPIYLFLIMGVIIFLAKKVRRFSSLKFSASKTFATLILLCYFSIAGTCIEVMALTRYTNVYGNLSYVRWNLDPTFPFGSKFHGVLIAFSLLVFLIYVVPFSILFLFPKFLYSSRFTNKFKPLYDAFWNPFKPQFRFWLSMRAMLRFVPFGLALFSSYPTNALLMVIFISILWFVHERIAPFVGYWQNAFDSFFMLNLIILFIGNIYYERYRDTSTDSQSYPVAYKALVYVLLITAYLAFVTILIIQVFIRFPKLREKLSKLKRMKKPESMTRPLLSLNGESTDKELDSAPENAPRVVHYSEFREPLIDEYGSIPITTHAVIQ